MSDRARSHRRPAVGRFCVGGRGGTERRVVTDPDLLAFVRQIRAEAELLRAVAREADAEMATIVAATRRKRVRERLAREGLAPDEVEDDPLRRGPRQTADEDAR
jgi:hypothetical protein